MCSITQYKFSNSMHKKDIRDYNISLSALFKIGINFLQIGWEASMVLPAINVMSENVIVIVGVILKWKLL